MTRKDSEKDAERPHYYSQFWLDIAAGRRVIGGPRPEEEAAEEEIPELPMAPARKAGRNSTADGHKETRATVAPVIEEEVEVVEPEEEEVEQEEDMVEEAEIPNIVLDEIEQEAPAPVEEEYVEEEEEEFFDEEEEEDDEDWGRRGRKKARPSRPTKPVKKPKPRRGF